MNLAILVGNSISGARRRNGWGPSGNRTRHSYRNRFTIRWPEGFGNRRTSYARRCLRDAIYASYRYAAGPATGIDQQIIRGSRDPPDVPLYVSVQVQSKSD